MKEMRFIANKRQYISSLLFLMLCSVFLFSSCHYFNNKQEKDNSFKMGEAAHPLYKLDVAKTEISWNAYKTNDKIKVGGYFKDVSIDREDQIFNSFYDLIDGLKFSINSLSSSSGDAMRDLTLNDYFFSYLSQDFRINGALGRPINDSIDVFFDIFGQEKVVRLAFVNYTIPPYFNQVIELKGTIHLEKQFNAIKAYNSLHEKCINLHRGADGISKTWKEVVVNVRAVIINTSVDRIKNH